jgi:hypothetical protein
LLSFKDITFADKKSLQQIYIKSMRLIRFFG